MQVHEEKNYSALAVVLDAVYDTLCTDVDQLDIRQVFFCAFLGNSLVNFFIVPNSLFKVCHRRLRVRVDVIRTAELYLANVV